METIKEEKKADLEQLLNSLIEKGYIPFNIPCITDVSFLRRLWITSHQNDRDYKFDFSLRDLVSKESGLWQFVCENGMVHLYTKHQIIIQEDDIITTYRPDYIFHDDEYYIIQSSLKDESELEDFLLSNIKVDE